MYGAGNIGRGFIGKRFYLSGWDVTFVDINEATVKQLQNDGGYPVYVTRGNEYVKEWVGNCTGFNGRDVDGVVKLISECDILATSLGVNVLIDIVQKALPLLVQKEFSVPAVKELHTQLPLQLADLKGYRWLGISQFFTGSCEVFLVRHFQKQLQGSQFHTPSSIKILNAIYKINQLDKSYFVLYTLVEQSQGVAKYANYFQHLQSVLG